MRNMNRIDGETNNEVEISSLSYFEDKVERGLFIVTHSEPIVGVAQTVF